MNWIRKLSVHISKKTMHFAWIKNKNNECWKRSSTYFCVNQLKLSLFINCLCFLNSIHSLLLLQTFHPHNFVTCIIAYLSSWIECDFLLGKFYRSFESNRIFVRFSLLANQVKIELELSPTAEYWTLEWMHCSHTPRQSANIKKFVYIPLHWSTHTLKCI